MAPYVGIVIAYVFKSVPLSLVPLEERPDRFAPWGYHSALLETLKVTPESAKSGLSHLSGRLP
jgi:hypothetical protein